MIAFRALCITRKLMQTTVRVEHAFSLHSLGRWYQRSGLRNDRDMLTTMAMALVVAPGDHAIGTDLPVTTDRGHWRGTVKYCERAGNQAPLWCART